MKGQRKNQTFFTESAEKKVLPQHSIFSHNNFVKISPLALAICTDFALFLHKNIEFEVQSS